MYKTVYSFDFDGTLCHTPTPEVGRDAWKRETGFNFPHTGWWGKAESIDPDVFYVPVNEWVYRKYLEASQDEDGAKILATGRLNKVPDMRKHVSSILRDHNLEFDEIMIIPGNDRYPENGTDGLYLCWGGGTYEFKIRLFEQLIKESGCEHFIMYDDRYEHIVRFCEWAKEQDCKITVVDIIHKNEKTFN